MDKIDLLRHEKHVLLQRLARIDDVLRKHDELQNSIAQLLASERPDVASFAIEPANGGGLDAVSDESSPHPSTYIPNKRASQDHRRGVSDSVRRFEELVARILANAEHPMDRRQLLGVLASQGYEVQGKVPENTLGTRMSRMPGVANIKTGERRGYWLEERLAELGL